MLSMFTGYTCIDLVINFPNLSKDRHSKKSSTFKHTICYVETNCTKYCERNTHTEEILVLFVIVNSK